MLLFNIIKTNLLLLLFNKEGSDLFAKMTSENVGSRFAIVLDGGLITAPVIREAITGGWQITGNFTNELQII